MGEVDYGKMLAGVRDVGEFGTRTLLPVSYYPMTLNVDTVAVNPFKTKDDNTETGGGVYAQLAGLVADGPFKNKDMNARVNLTTGKTGGYLGWLTHTIKAITGKDPLYGAMGEYGFPMIDGDAQARQEAIAAHYFGLDLESRLDFMAKFTRVGEWAKKLVVASVTHEKGDKRNRDGSEQWFPRYAGFYALADAKKGKDYLLKVAFPEQEIAKAAMGEATE